jgi:Raf kinase inhibitor-like YbhB/YbcL family protein
MRIETRTSSALAMMVAATLLGACGGAARCPDTTSGGTSSGDETALRDPTSAPESITVSIGGLADGGTFPMAQVFSGFGCTGENHSPALTWTPGPEGTQSYAIVMHDPDAPTGVGFFHWVVVDLPAATTSLPENASATEAAMPQGAIQAYTDFGANGYGGPCPPPGAPHRYEISVYALDVPSLGVPTGATGALTRFMLAGHTLALGRAVATYGR